MVRVSGVVMSLVAVLWVSVPSFAQTLSPPPAAAPAPRPTSQPWKERLDREPLPDSQPAPVQSWYGWQTLLVDGLSVGVAMLGAVAAEDAYVGLWLGIGTFTIGGPLVHFAHRNVAQGFSSLAMRAVPAGLVAIALVINEEREGVGLGFVGLLGAAVVMAVDAAVFAWDEQPQSRASLAPWLDPQQGRIGLAYASSF